VSTSAPLDPRITRSRTDWRIALPLVVLTAAALFTALIAHRVAPQHLAAGSEVTRHTLSDGTVVTLRPGSVVNVVRSFSLWGGVGARPRLIRWTRGSGQVALSSESLPFYIVTPDAELNVSEGTVDIDLSASRGTRIQAFNGRPTITVRDRGSVAGVMASNGALTVAEPGEVLEVRNGALDINEDVAGEDTAGRKALSSGA
jgi:ferric-dicitrate binding protein FerR (iron transport regulator)